MSRFIDKLRQASLAASRPMGFGRGNFIAKPRLMLVAHLAQADVNGLVDHVAGADAGLLSIASLSSGARVFNEVCQTVPDIPWGGWLKSIDREGIRQIAAAGCDFVVFPAASSSLKILENDEPGKILEVEASLEAGLLRAVNELPADAVLIASEPEGEYSLTWHHLMHFKRLADLLTKPLLVPIPANVTAGELQTLWETGIDGVVVKVMVGQPAGRVKKLRQMIDGLVVPLKHRREKTEALLSYTGGEARVLAEEEEEEE